MQQAGPAVGAPGQAGMASETATMRLGADEMIYGFKIVPCSRRVQHDWTACFFLHKGERARRRDLRTHQYAAVMCCDMLHKGSCAKGDACEDCHNVFEYHMHPANFRTKMCHDGANCTRAFCFFAHSLDELRLAAPVTVTIGNPQDKQQQQQQQQQQPVNTCSSTSTGMQVLPQPLMQLQGGRHVLLASPPARQHTPLQAIAPVHVPAALVSQQTALQAAAPAHVPVAAYPAAAAAGSPGTAASCSSISSSLCEPGCLAEGVAMQLMPVQSGSPVVCGVAAWPQLQQQQVVQQQQQQQELQRRIEHLEAVAMAAVNELSVLQQAADGMRAEPSLAPMPTSTQPLQCTQVLPGLQSLPYPAAAAAAASNAGLILAADCTPASWNNSCSSAATCLAAAAMPASSLQLQCMMNPADGCTAVQPLLPGQQQQQVLLQQLLPQQSFGSAEGFSGISGFNAVAGSSYPAGLGTCMVTPAAATTAAAAGGMVMLSSVPLQGAAAMHQGCCSTQPLPVGPTTVWLN